MVLDDGLLRFGKRFYVDSNGITLGVDNLLRVVIMEILGVMQQKSKIVSILLSFDVLLVG